MDQSYKFLNHKFLLQVFWKLHVIVYRQRDYRNIKFSAIYWNVALVVSSINFLPATAAVIEISDIIQFLIHFNSSSVSQSIKGKSGDPQNLLKMYSKFTQFISENSWCHRKIVTIFWQVIHRHNNIKIFCIVYKLATSFLHEWPKWSIILDG